MFPLLCEPSEKFFFNCRPYYMLPQLIVPSVHFSPILGAEFHQPHVLSALFAQPYNDTGVCSLYYC